MQYAASRIEQTTIRNAAKLSKGLRPRPWLIGLNESSLWELVIINAANRNRLPIKSAAKPAAQIFHAYVLQNAFRGTLSGRLLYKTT